MQCTVSQHLMCCWIMQGGASSIGRPACLDWLLQPASRPADDASKACAPQQPECPSLQSPRAPSEPESFRWLQTQVLPPASTVTVQLMVNGYQAAPHLRSTAAMGSMAQVLVLIASCAHVPGPMAIHLPWRCLQRCHLSPEVVRLARECSHLCCECGLHAAHVPL